MKTTKIELSKILHSQRSKPFRIGTALILAVLMLAAPATAQTYTDLYTFDGTHGADPQAILTQGRDGNLYGTTYNGGTHGAGVVFMIAPSGSLTVLYNFDGGINGGYPEGGLTLGTDGNFYGTTYYGGANNYYGTIFKITPTGDLTTLYSFCSQSNCADGEQPSAPPIEAADGNFYGATAGQQYYTYFTGVVSYKITSSGAFTLLSPPPGQSQAPLLYATDGTFYGTTYGYGGGAVFKLSEVP